MLRTLAGVTALLMAVLVQPAARGAVVGFDEFPGNDPREPFGTYTEDGFTLTPMIGDFGGDWLINRNSGNPIPSLENDTGFSEGETGAIVVVTGGLFRFRGLDMLCGAGGVVDCEFFATGSLEGSTVFDSAAAGDDTQARFVGVDSPRPEAIVDRLELRLLRGNTFFDNIELTPVPAPASLPLLFAGLAALGLTRRRRETRAKSR